MFKIIWGVELFFFTTISYLAEDIVATQLGNVCENGQGGVKGAPYTPLKIMEDLCNSIKYLDTPLKMVIVVCTNHFDLTYFQ